MQRLMAIAAIGLSLAGVSAARAAPDDDKDSVWLTQPSFEQLYRALTHRVRWSKVRAAPRSHGTAATIRCTVKPDGFLTDCSVVSESHPDSGLGDAALALADKFRMKPDAVAALPTRTVTVPIRWTKGVTTDWASKPDGKAFAAHFPKSAIAWNIHGHARIVCRVKADGSLTDCFLDLEAPRGYGFGQATLDIAASIRMKPNAPDGRSAEGAVVIIPINWFLSDVVYTPVFEVGDNDLLVTYMQPGEQPKDPKNPVFPCASPGDRGRRCQGHPFGWDDRPTNDELWQVIAHANVKDRETRLSCSLGDDGRWKECRVSGEATAEEEATMRTLAKDMIPEPEANDGVSLKSGRITLFFDWPRLKWISGAAKDHPGGAEPKSTH